MPALYDLLGGQASEATAVVLSGFGGEVVRVSDPPRAAVTFTNERVACKALLEREAPTIAWLEYNRDMPVTLVMAPAVEMPRQQQPKTADVPRSAASAEDPEDDAAPMPMDFSRPCTFDSFLYTPLEAVMPGSSANILGILAESPYVNMPSQKRNGRTDAMVRLTLRSFDPASLCATHLASNLFARSLDLLPTHAGPGDAVLLRGIQIHGFNHRASGVGPAFMPYVWATYNAASKALHVRKDAVLGREERRALISLATDATQRTSGTAAVHSRTRPIVTLDALEPMQFVDVFVEVVKVFAQSTPPDLYVTDYTPNSLFYENDTHLARRHGLGARSTGRFVFQLGLWQQQGQLALTLRPGQFVRINNMRVRMTPKGVLAGAVGNRHDHGYMIVPVDENEPAVQALLARRAVWLEEWGGRPRQGAKRSSSQGPAAPEAKKARDDAGEADTVQASPSEGRSHCATESTPETEAPHEALAPEAELGAPMCPPPRAVHGERFSLDLDDADVWVDLDGGSASPVYSVTDSAAPECFHTHLSVLGIVPDDPNGWIRRCCAHCDRMYVR